MTDPKDKDRNQNTASEPASQPPDTPTEGKRSGRVAFDARGNPIWEWQLETGVYSRELTTQKFRKLDLGDLSIAETAIHRQPPGLSPGSLSSGATPLPGGGFNPYDSSARSDQKMDPYDNARVLADKVKAPAQTSPLPDKPSRPAAAPGRNVPLAAPARKKSMLDKLDKWFKGRRKQGEDSEYE